MKGKPIILLVTLVILAAPLAAGAQQAAKVWRSGYVTSQNIVIESRWADESMNHRVRPPRSRSFGLEKHRCARSRG